MEASDEAAAQQPVQLITLTQEQLQMLLNSRSSEDPDSSTRRTQRPSRPSIQPDTTDEDWRLFLFQWERYKNQCKLTSVSAIRDELLSTCSQDLEKQLFNLAGTSLNGLTEEKLLAQIKEVAVRGLNVEVHRHQFHAMRQSQGEDITQYVSRLRSKASLCSFSVTAFRPTKEAKDPGPVSYEEDALRTQMVVGLYDKEHQNRILNDTAKHPSFKELYQALLTMEAADTSRLKLSDSKQQTTDTDLSAAQRSQYQRDRRNRNHPPETSKKETVTPCRWCNGTTHDTTQRWQHDDCPARGKLCKKCGKLNHVTSACRSTSSQRRQRPQWRSQDETSAQQDVSDSDDISFCFSQDEVKIESEHDQPAKGGNPHQEWKHGEFVDSRPKRHPEVNVKLTILHDSHEKMGKFTSLSTRAKMVSGVTRQACADTGAMTCTSGPELLQALNCPRQYLVRTRHRIQGVTGDGLQIMGTLLLQIELGERSTRQVVYITKNTSGLYLSETALRDLGLIHPEFRLLHPFVDTERKATVTVRPPSVPLSPSLLTQPMTTPMRDRQPGDPPAIQHHQPATPPSATRRPSHVSGDDTHVPGHNTYQTHQGSAVTPPHRNQRWATPSAEPGEALCPVSPTSAAGPVHQTGEPRETTVSPGRTPAADVGRRHPPPSPPPASSKPVPVEPPQCEETRPESRRSTRRAIPRRRFSPQMRGKFHRVSSDV